MGFGTPKEGAYRLTGGPTPLYSRPTVMAGLRGKIFILVLARLSHNGDEDGQTSAEITETR